MHRRSSRKSILNEFPRSPRWPLCRILESKVFVIKATGCYPSLRPNERNERNPSRDRSAARYLNNLIKREKEEKRERCKIRATSTDVCVSLRRISTNDLGANEKRLLCSPRLLREKSPGRRILSASFPLLARAF